MNSPMENLATLLTWMGSIFPWIASHAVIIVPAMLVSGTITFVQLRRVKLDPIKQRLWISLMVFVLPLLAANVVPKSLEERHDILTWTTSELLWLASQAAVIISFALLSGGLVYLLPRRLSSDPRKQWVWGLLLVVVTPILIFVFTPAVLLHKYHSTIDLSVFSGCITGLSYLIHRNLRLIPLQSRELTTADRQPPV